MQTGGGEQGARTADEGPTHAVTTGRGKGKKSRERTRKNKQLGNDTRQTLTGAGEGGGNQAVTAGNERRKSNGTQKSGESTGENECQGNDTHEAHPRKGGGGAAGNHKKLERTGARKNMEKQS